MEDNWKHYTTIDFTDASILQYHIDTRDFHCSCNTNPAEKIKELEQVAKVYGRQFVYNADELLVLLDRFYLESGGKVDSDWRLFSLNHKVFEMDVWQLKYIRIFRVATGLIVCNKDKYALRKEILNCPVNQENLHA